MKIIKLMYLDGMKLFMLKKNETPEMNYEFGFRFMKNSHFSEIYTNDREVFEKWKNVLVRTCILSTFHEEFEVKKMIGKGSFAKVYLATKRVTGRDYAIKAFSKEFVQSQSKGPVNFIKN